MAFFQTSNSLKLCIRAVHSKYFVRCTFYIVQLVSQRLTVLQHVLDALQGFAFTGKGKEGFAFQIQQVLLVDQLAAHLVAAGEMDVEQRAGALGLPADDPAGRDEPVAGADASGAPGFTTLDFAQILQNQDAIGALSVQISAGGRALKVTTTAWVRPSSADRTPVPLAP